MSSTESVFTDHVRNVVAQSVNDDDSAIWEAMWRVLKAELRRRGILSAGPIMLGYDGESWNDEAARNACLADAWRRAIRSRLRGLERNLNKTGCIERLVKRNLRNFIGERQERHDPAGKAFFENSKTALVFLCEQGVMHRHDAELHDKWKAGSEFGPPSSADVAPSDAASLQAALEQSGIQFEGLESLLVIKERPQEQLVDGLRALEAHGCMRFSIRSLVRALRDLATASGIDLETAAKLRFSDFHDDFSENSRTVAADAGYAQDEHNEHVFQQIHELIDQSSRKDAIKARLHSVADIFESNLKEDDPVDAPTVREIADQLGMSKSTLADDMAEVRRIAQHVLTSQMPEAQGERHA